MDFFQNYKGACESADGHHEFAAGVESVLLPADAFLARMIAACAGPSARTAVCSCHDSLRIRPIETAIAALSPDPTVNAIISSDGMVNNDGRWFNPALCDRFCKKRNKSTPFFEKT